jgi:hypothetical protein
LIQRAWGKLVRSHVVFPVPRGPNKKKLDFEKGIILGTIVSILTLNMESSFPYCIAQESMSRCSLFRFCHGAISDHTLSIPTTIVAQPLLCAQHGRWFFIWLNSIQGEILEKAWTGFSMRSRGRLGRVRKHGRSTGNEKDEKRGRTIHRTRGAVNPG